MTPVLVSRLITVTKEYTHVMRKNSFLGLQNAIPLDFTRLNALYFYHVEEIFSYVG